MDRCGMGVPYGLAMQVVMNDWRLRKDAAVNKKRMNERMENKKNIVILDAFTTDQGQLSWLELERMAQVTVYERTRPDEVIDRCREADLVLTNKVQVGAKEMEALPRLKYIGVLATGYNVVDVAEAARRGIVVTNIPAYSTDSVAQMVFAHLLNIVGRTDHYARENREGRWTRSQDFCYLDHRPLELAGKRMGIVGLGHTGMATARIALAFGMKVVAFTSRRQEDLPEGITKGSMDDVFATCDVVSLHCPMDDSTFHLVDRERIATMKPHAILINTGRGPLVDDADLADALNHGRLAAYGADVLTVEPPAADNPLLRARNCYLTPHIAWATEEARQRLVKACVENVRAFLEGEPIHQVN